MTDRADQPPQILVGYAQAARLAESADAARQELAASETAAEAAEATSPEEETEFLASLGRALAALEEAEDEASPTVMVAPGNALASLMQSVLADAAADAGTFSSLPAGGAEAAFDKGDVFGWLRMVWKRLKTRKKHPIPRPDPVAEPFSDHARMALFADWGTGLYGAPRIAQTLERDAKGFDFLLHLGDVYYAGTRKEVTERFLDLWPRRDDARSIALNSNHEMYSGGQGYFLQTLPRFEQESSYLALQNEHWLLVGLDTGHLDHDLDDQQVAWLRRVIDDAGSRRKVVLFSHHQLFSSFGSQGSKLAAKLGDLLEGQRIFAWYWGHEHLCMRYDPHPETGLIARCLGHGGMPYPRKRLVKFPVHEQISKHAVWRRADLTEDAPGGIFLEGENPFIVGEEHKFGPHGYMTLEFDREGLVEQAHEPDGAVIYRHRLS